MPENVLVVVGLGNEQCGDDGLGAAAIRLLASRYDAPAGVRVVDAAALAPDALPDLGEVEALVVDAVSSDCPPGAFVRLAGDEVASLLRERLPGRTPRRTVVLGLVPATREPGDPRSRAVEAGLAGLVCRIVLEARLLGHHFTRRRDCVAAAS